MAVFLHDHMVGPQSCLEAKLPKPDVDAELIGLPQGLRRIKIDGHGGKEPLSPERIGRFRADGKLQPNRGLE